MIKHTAPCLTLLLARSRAPRRALPGADGCFVGPGDELAVVLANSGRSLTVYETAKLAGAGAGAKPLYSAELKEGLVAAVYPGGCWAGLGQLGGWLGGTRGAWLPAWRALLSVCSS